MITPLIILTILTTPLIMEWSLANRQQRPLRLQSALYLGLAMAFFFFCIGHFIKTAGMIDMLPAWMPHKALLVYLTGVLELIVAIGLLIKRIRVLSAYAAITILVMFFPVNIYAAWYHVGLGGHQWGPVYLLIRAPLQAILIGWCYQAIKNEKHPLIYSRVTT